jgi:CHAD domain-containing protein
LLLLQELAQRSAAPPRAIERVRTAVTEERQKRRRDMLDAIKPSKLDKLRKRLVQVAAPRQRPAAATGSALAEATMQAVRRAGELRDAIEYAGSIYLADRLHRVRIAAKKLRYSLEIQRELTRSRSTTLINRLKAQQDLLGRMHDLEILIDRARGVQSKLTPRDRRGMAELKALIRLLEAECREGHASYMRARQALLKLCDTVQSAGRSRSAA